MVGTVGIAVAQNATIIPEGPVTVVEGNNLTINCTDGVNTGAAFLLRENEVQLIGNSTPPTEVNGVVRTLYIPVDRTKSGNNYSCLNLLTAMETAVITLTVICKCNG